VFALDDRLLALALVLLYEQSAWGFVRGLIVNLENVHTDREHSRYGGCRRERFHIVD
jgi:hypothetical protein